MGGAEIPPIYIFKNTSYIIVKYWLDDDTIDINVLPWYLLALTPLLSWAD